MGDITITLRISKTLHGNGQFSRKSIVNNLSATVEQRIPGIVSKRNTAPATATTSTAATTTPMIDRTFQRRFFLMTPSSDHIDPESCTTGSCP